jgi:NADP-dependent 3-hydroxy acid dehydrogenase YdfG
MKNKIIWITGASRGIGFACAKALAARGAKLVLSCSSQETARAMKKEFAETPDVYIMPFDIRNDVAIKKVVQKVKLTMGQVDILINNAGIAKFGADEEMSIEDLYDMTAINFRGAH